MLAQLNALLQTPHSPLTDIRGVADALLSKISQFHNGPYWRKGEIIVATDGRVNVKVWESVRDHKGYGTFTLEHFFEDTTRTGLFHITDPQQAMAIRVASTQLVVDVYGDVMKRYCYKLGKDGWKLVSTEGSVREILRTLQFGIVEDEERLRAEVAALGIEFTSCRIIAGAELISLITDDGTPYVIMHHMGIVVIKSLDSNGPRIPTTRYALEISPDAATVTVL